MKQVLIFEYLHPSWPPRLTGYCAPPQSRRDHCRETFIAQRIIAMSRTLKPHTF